MPPKTKPDHLPTDSGLTTSPPPATEPPPAPHLAQGVPADGDARALVESLRAEKAASGTDQDAPAALEAVALPPLRLRALHPVRHNGTRYGPGLPAGDEFSADDATAAELRGLGVVELLGEESPE